MGSRIVRDEDRKYFKMINQMATSDIAELQSNEFTQARFPLAKNSKSPLLPSVADQLASKGLD